tara:strand:+ start:855 stop:1301 length:447 start_codon:yes stop_codon:yes gene_type:complete
MKDRKHIKVYESYSGSDSYVEIIDTNVYGRVDLYNKPTSTLEGKPIDKDSEIELRKVLITFDLDITYKTSGIDGISFLLRSVAVEGVVNDYDYNEQANFDILDDDISNERYDTEMGKLPLYIDTMEIDMNGSFDTSKWEYAINIGNFN